MDNQIKFEDLLGRTLKSITGSTGDDKIEFVTDDGNEYALLHYQDCCENVFVEDIIGDLDDLVGHPLLMAEEISNAEEPEDADIEWRDDSETWTFYKLATVKGYVTIRWYGSSNGYYSESVDFVKTN